MLSLGAAACAMVTNAFAGGQLDDVKLIDGASTVPGLIDFEAVPIAWPTSCSTIVYTMDDIPATGVDVETVTVLTIPPEVLAEEIQESFDSWNEIETSFIEMQMGDIVAIGNGVRSFDFINEVTWETPAGSGFLASSPSTTLLADVDAVAGDDIDLDGDSDIFDPAAVDPALADTCHDADGDGDIEFPAGFYPAGTIFDNDVQFNDPAFNGFGIGFFWELEPSADALPAFGLTGADVQAVAVHEFGHSHGLSHSLINQISDTDGTGSTMFPFIDIGDPGAEAGSRTLHDDDIAWSSFVYPEGSERTGPAALQSGDVAFDRVYDVMRGTVRTGDGDNVLGANVFAAERGSGRIVGEGFSGRALLFLPPLDANFNFGDRQVVDAETNALDGEFEIPVLRGLYEVFLQATDGDPAAATSISLTAITGDDLGQQIFPEEGHTLGGESNLELRPDQATPLFSRGGISQRLRFITNEESLITPAGEIDFIGTGTLDDGEDTFTYAQVFDRDVILSQIADGEFAVAGAFRTGTLDASNPVVFEQAQLAFVTVAEDGSTINIESVIRSSRDLNNQESDLTRFELSSPEGLRFQLVRVLRSNPDYQVALLLEADISEELRGASGFPPAFVSLDAIGFGGNDPVTGSSFQSIDGAPFTLRATDVWNIELRFVNTGRNVPRFLSLDF